jgi:hypothetical protein
MNEKSALMAVIITAAMLGTVIAPAGAWEYWNTTIAIPVTDNHFQIIGPRVDKVEIQTYANEAAEFAAMETGQIDLTDCPVDAAHYSAWANAPLDGKIALVAQGQAFDMFILDMRLDNRLYIAPGVPNPARTAPFGNPMADVWLRRAIASVVDRKQMVQQIICGGAPPLLAKALYTPLGCAYGQWQHPQLSPGGALAAYLYVNPDGSANVALGNQFLDEHGYTMVGGKRTKNGVPFQIQFYYRTDDPYRNAFATLIMQPLLTAAPPNGLGLDVTMLGVTSAGARSEVMGSKKGHLYTGGWGLTSDPDHLYYLFHVNGYWHPGYPENYMYYPGDANKYQLTVPGTYDGRGYGNDLVPYSAPALDFSDPSGPYWKATDGVWENPQNYWSWEMMTATTQGRAIQAAYKSQEFLAYWVCGEPIWVSQSFTAFNRRYTGGTDGVPLPIDDGENQYRNQHWIQVVNQKGVGVGSAASLFNMHIGSPWWGSHDPSKPVTIRWGFSQGVNSLNPIYANWASDWNVLGCCYNSLIGTQPYLLTDMRSLANTWTIGTWFNPVLNKLCTQIDFQLKSSLRWSDGECVTADDVAFSLGGPNAVGSMSWWLKERDFPPAYWSQQVAHNLYCYAVNAGYVRIKMDTLAYIGFGKHSMSGFVPILPKHIWYKLIRFSNPVVTQPFGVPSVCSGGFKLESTQDPGVSGKITLIRNVGGLNKGVPNPSLPVPKSRSYEPGELVEDAAPLGVEPISIYAAETSNATEEVDSTHYIFPKANETGLNLNVSYVLEEQWAYETGENITDVYPYTRFGGGVNVTLKKWNGTSPYSDPANYAMWGGNGTARTFVAEMGVPVAEPITFMNVGPGWYVAEVSVNITSLEYSVDNGTSWIMVPSDQNPFYGVAYSYDEYTLVTSRYDILGAYWEIIDSTGYQSVPDLRVDVKDVYACGKAYGSMPGYSNWDPACDVNNDYKVDVKDYYKICQNYGWTAP